MVEAMASFPINFGNFGKGNSLDRETIIEQPSAERDATRGYKTTDLDAVMPGPHLVSSLLKRWIAGTLHYRLSHRHMPYYLDEFTFRFNRRNSRARGMLFYRLLQQAVDTDPHPLKELIHGH
jgi:hypothetical protein